MQDAVTLVSCFFQNSWQFLNTVTVPGLGVPLAAFLIAGFLIDFGIRFTRWLIGFSDSGK